MSLPIDPVAFAKLTQVEADIAQRLGIVCDFQDGETLFESGQSKIDLYIVLHGQVAIVNPADQDAVVVIHDDLSFVGDIDLITGRPVLVTAISKGPSRVARIPHAKIRVLLNQLPTFSEKLIVGFSRRRELLSKSNALGLQVVGDNQCRETNLVKEFLYKSFVPFTWHDPSSETGQRLIQSANANGSMPLIQLTDGRMIVRPTLRELANSSGAWQACDQDQVQLAIIGAGPAGMAAAVYAASEGIKTLLIDRLGPGGQAGSSSRIENFIGFPAGLTGTELASRGILQMMKFGAKISAPYCVESLEPPTAERASFLIRLDEGSEVFADVVLVATGVKWRTLDAVGSKRFERAGLHYACTAIEAEYCDGQPAGVVGGGNSAGQAAMFLAERCPERDVFIIVRGKFGVGMSEYLSNRIMNTQNIIIKEFTQVAAVDGQGSLQEIVLEKQNPDSPESAIRETLSCHALFVFIGAEPECSWLPKSIARDALGYLQTGLDVVRSGLWHEPSRDPLALETSIPGLLAGGDIRSGSTKRVGFAVGDGSMAVTCTHKLLSLRHQH